MRTKDMKDLKVVFVFWLVFIIDVQKVDSQNTYVDILQKSFRLLVPQQLNSKDYQSKLSFAHHLSSKLEKNVRLILSNPSLMNDGMARQQAWISSNKNSNLREDDNQYNISQKCLDNLLYLVNNFNSTANIQMLDSDFKPAAGILKGTLLWLGDYDECVAVSVNSPLQNGTHFNGKYCTATVGKKMNTTDLPVAFFPSVEPVLGVCVPDSCSGQDVATVIDFAIYLFDNESSITANTVNCQDNDKDLSDRAIASIVFFSLFCVLLVVGTGYDIFLTSFPVSFTDEESTPLLKANSSTEEIVKVVKHKQGRIQELILSFSMYTNGKKLLSTHQLNTSLRAVHGVRFLSMSWVILGHTLVFGLGITGNVTGLLAWTKRWTFQAIINGTFSVDTFFAISGLLLTYLTMNELHKTKGKLNWFMFYFHRYWRLTPPVALVMFLYIPLVEYWSNGPLYPQHGVEIDYCENSWWRNILYIQNLYDTGHMCMGWTWYLANDMQFYIISPLLILPLFMFPILGFIVFGVILFGTFLATGLISRLNHLSTVMNNNDVGEENSFDMIYVKPWCRLGAYLIGMLTGYILHKTTLSFRLKWYTNVLGWALATAVALAVLYGLVEVERGTVVMSYDVSALYNTLSRTAWSAAVCWLIFACCTGNGGFINTILSWEAFIPLSRLTYMAYLIHPVVMYVIMYSRRTLFYVTDLEYVMTFLGFMVLTYMISFILSLAFESPMIGLERTLLKREKRN